MTTHANLAYNVEVYRRWLEVDEADRFLGGAPLFHVTGLVAGIGLCLAAGVPLILFHRFHPGTCLRLGQRWRATITIMAITAYQSLMLCPEMVSSDLASLKKVYSGGAPVPARTAGLWHEATGAWMHNIYGLTETTSPSHATPLGSRGSVDPESGANSVGLPVPGAEVRVIDPATGHDVAVGESGEIWIKGPMVASGYWRNPEATAESFAGGWLRTGDIDKRDAEGWFYILDRAKDMINASGYKVYPREVEEILLQFPAIMEAAVVGVADEYRGETVKAFVVAAGVPPSAEDIIDFCRNRLAAYKYPRLVEFVNELPKTASGKVLRRELRQHS